MIDNLEQLKQLIAELEPQLVNPLTPKMRDTLHKIMEIIRNAT